MEPSRVYGYISLVDPTTGQTHLSTNGPYTNGHIGSLTAIFRSATGERVDAALSLGTSQRGLAVINNSSGIPAAYRYDIHLNQYPGYEGAPSMGVLADYCNIDYDPEQYQFESIEVEPYFYPDPEGPATDPIYGRQGYSIPLEARPAPFPDFPDLP